MGLALQFAVCTTLAAFFVTTVDVTPAYAQASSCNIASNGSFESPNIQTTPQRAGENTAYVNGYAIWRTSTYPTDGWQTVSGTFDYLRYYNNASDGMQSIDLFGTSAATVRQTFTGLVPGQQYTFSIDYSGHLTTQAPALVQLGNGNGVSPVTIASLRPVANSISNGNAGIPTTPSYTVTWATYQHTFTAAGTEATVQFVETGTGSTGLFIDNFTFAGAGPCSDLSITKADGSTTFTRGSGVTYQIVVSNAGPSGAIGARVTDPLPSGITTANWTCGSATNGAVCGAASGTGAINTTANLPVGSSLTYSLTMAVPAGYPGVVLTNTATVATPTGVTDPVTSNNSASDTNSVSPPQPSFGACTSTMYLGVGAPTQLHSVDTSANPLTYPPIGSPYSPGYNAMGYDPLSNFIYAAWWDTATSIYRLLRVGGDGTVADLGSISGGGINVSGSGIASGEVGADGFFYVKHNTTTNQMWRVDLTTRVATLITLSQSFASGDITWSNGLLYAQDHVTGFLVSVNPANGTVTPIGPSGFIGDANAFGSMMGASNGVFGRRNSGGFYKFDLATGQATLISGAPAGGGDGAKCATTPVEFPVDLAISKTDGTTTYAPGFDATYTIVVSNNGPFGVQNAQVSDPLPAGITNATWTCGNATGGGICDVASGTGGISTTADLPAGASVTYTLSLDVPASYSGSLTNTATVTAPADAPDTNMANNTASDTDTMEPPPPSGACSPRLVTAGNSFTMAPFPITGTVTKNAARGWQTDNPWATLGGNYTFRWNFSQPIPVNWIQFAVADVNETSGIDYDANPPVFTISLSGGTANTADFSLDRGDLIYSGGALRFRPGGPYRQSGYLEGNSADTVTSITITSTGVAVGDNIANVLYVRPPCLTVAKVSQGATGSFTINMTNVVDASAATVGSTTLTTTTPGTAVSSPLYFARDTRTDLTLSEVVPANWALESAVCTDQNASITGNPTVIGSFTSPTMTIPAANVRPQANISCLFSNRQSAADLAITKTDGSATYTAGADVVYTIVASNNGPAAVSDAVIGDPLPSGITNASWTCGNAVGGAVCDVASGTGAINTTADLPSGGSVTYTLTMGVPANRTGDLVNTATVTAPTGVLDSNTANNTATDTDTRAPVDLAITKTDGSPTYTAGTDVIYTIVASNAGPSAAMDAVVSDPLPAGITTASWTCGSPVGGAVCDVASGTGAINTTADLPAGGSVTYTLTMSVTAGFTGNLANTATVRAPAGVIETNTANNTATDTDTRAPVDLAITKTDGSPTYTAGTDVVYTIVVSNAGPSPAMDAVVSDPLPSGITSASWACGSPVGGAVCDVASGTGAISTTADLPAGGSVTYTLTMSVPATFTGNLVNRATVTAPAGVPETTTANNSAVDTDTRTPVDLSITKDDGRTIYTVGDLITYTIVVSNAGPAPVVGAQVSDPLPTGITVANWTCGTTVNGGVCGQASGTGGINTTADLPSGASVTYTLSFLAPSTYAGDLVNTATVTAPTGVTETTTANNSATDTDTRFPPPPSNVAQISCTTDQSIWNTGYNGAGGRLGAGADSYWQVAVVPDASTNNTGTPPAGLSYTAAQVVTDAAVLSTWGGQKYANAAWVSHAPDAFHDTYLDSYYRYQFDLGPGVDPATFTLSVDWFSDNRVYRIYVNGQDQGVVDSGGGWTASSTGLLNGPWQSGFNEIIVHVQSGSASSGSGDSAGLAAQVTPQPLCEPATLSLNKTTSLAVGGPFSFALTNTVQAAGSVTTTAADTATPVDGDTSSAGTAEPFAVAVFGADVTITEDALPAGWQLMGAGCTANGVPVGSLSGSTYTIPGAQVDASGEAFVCSFTNAAPNVARRKELINESGAIPNVAEPGETLTYRLTLTNTGGAADTGYDLVDNYDPNTVVVDAAGGVDNGDTITWTDLTVPAQTGSTPGTVVLTIRVRVVDELPDGTTHVANVIHEGATPPPPNYCATDPTPADCVRLPVPGPVTPAKVLDSESGSLTSVAEPGETLTYRVTLTNSGAGATLYPLRDDIDALTTYVAGSALVAGSAREPDVNDGDTLLWRNILVPANDSVTVTYAVVAASPIPEGTTQIGNLAYEDGEPPPDCGVTPTQCVILPTPGVVVPVKTLAGEDGQVADVAEPGEMLTYQVVLTNSDDQPALYPLRDNIDELTTYVAGSAVVGGSAREPDVNDGDTLLWRDILVPANDAVTVTYAVRVSDPIPTGTTDIGNVAYEDGKPQPDCSVAPQQCVVLPVPGAVTPGKTLAGEDGQVADVAEPGETLTYQVVLTNSGSGATLFDLTDDIDGNTTYVAGSATVDGTAQEPTGSDPLVWDGILVPGGGAATVLYRVRVADTIPHNVTVIGNVAYRRGDPPPDCTVTPTPPNCVVFPAQKTGLEIVKGGAFEDTDNSGGANVGDRIVYTFTIENTSNVPLTDVTPVDEGPTFNGIAGTGTFSAFTPDTVELAPNQSQVFEATYTLSQADVDNGAGVEDGVENAATALGYANGSAVTGTLVESGESVAVLALPAAVSNISVTKVANLRFIRRGEEAPFTIGVINNAGSRALGITVVDTIPAGFRYVEGSATVDGVAATPEVSGREIRFTGITVEGNDEVQIRLRLLALSTAVPGEHVNRAHAEDASGNRFSSEARAVVEILVEPVFDCGDIIGKVFDDRNRNGYQDEGEPGLPGVRIATVNGELLTTDLHGRFHVPCAALPDQRLGSNFIMKLDTRTLPTGYRLTTENPRVVRLTAGKMTELNFGASIGRVVRLDLQDGAFEPGELELKPEWARGIDQLIAMLGEEQSVLRLTYIDAGADPEFAEERLKQLRDLIGERWRQTSGPYRLEIEMRVETGE